MEITFGHYVYFLINSANLQDAVSNAIKSEIYKSSQTLASYIDLLNEVLKFLKQITSQQASVNHEV